MLPAMLFPAPPAPAFSPDATATTERQPRYEDFTQDGRLNPLAIPPSLATLWQTTIARNPGARNARASGVISLLTRLTVSSLDQPIRVQTPVESTVGFELAHDRDAAGEVSRLYMNVWADLRGIPGRGGPGGARPASRDPVLAGHAFAEHTFTRPFAPPDQRRVTSFAGIEGYPEIPAARHTPLAPSSAAEAPAGATWQGELAADPVETRFTLDQTDANQHVNSAVYVRCFLDAVQRRLAADGYPARLRSKAFDIAYRKPCFVGDRVRAHIRMFMQGEYIGGAGFIATAGQPGGPARPDGEAKPCCYVRVLFGP
jgi:hypothetical protein